MADVDKIIGKRRFEVFEQLKKNNTLITLRLWGKDYQRLTVVSDILVKRKISYLLVDCPEDFTEAVADDEIWKIQVEFAGDDGLQYTFSTSGENISQGMIWVKFPEFIERQQRRQYFRMEVPPGTVLRLKDNDVTLEMRAIDISLRGSLGTPVGKKNEIQNESILKAGNTLKDVELVLPGAKEDQKIHVKMSLVVRQLKNPVTGKDQYAIHFTHLERDEEKALTELIYQFQRQFLRKRLPIKE